MPLVTYTWLAVVVALACAAIGWLGIAGWMAMVVVAASLAAAAGLWMWLTTLQNGRPAAPAPTTQVVQVMTEEGQPVYVVVQDGQMTVIDPRTIDGKASREASKVQAVRFITPVPQVQPSR